MFKLLSAATALTCLLTAGAMAEEVEITLVDELDGNLNSYCLDISGGLGPSADPANGLQAHTCYSYRGSLEVDQIFDTEQFAEGILYMPRFDVCATLSGTQAGASIGLATCDGSDMQQIALEDDGTLRPAGRGRHVPDRRGRNSTWPRRHIAAPDQVADPSGLR